ncbi:MAG: glycosyltransferase family 2 protein [Chloroflexi bacterium]|nr:glycosyltransferase family 2 protein [Chloroflexota bacterium]
MGVAVIVPVLNEAEAIAGVIREVASTGLADEIVVVDGGSRDGTVDAARAAGAEVVIEQRPGYGRACATGVLASSADILAFLDGDGADDGTALGRMVQPIMQGTAELTLGSRLQREANAMPWHAALGNSLGALLVNRLWDQRVRDFPSFKAIRRADLLRLRMSEATYGWTVEMIVKAAKGGLRVHEVPIDYRRRRGGESKVSGNVRTSARAAASILGTLARHGWSRNGHATLLPDG